MAQQNQFQQDIVAETMREDGMNPQSSSVEDHLNLLSRCIQKLDKKIQDIDKAQDELSDYVMDDITPLFNKLTPLVNKQTAQKPKKKIRKMILTDTQKQILELYRKGHKQKEIAQKVNCTEPNVSIRVQRMRDMGYL